MGIARFRNDHFTAITGYRDYVQGNLTICHGLDLLTGSRESNLYTISIFELAASSPVCLLSKATSIKSWLSHRRLSHFNFSTINQLTSKELVDGLPKFNTESKLELIRMDLCGPMRVESINGKKYILVIVYVYSRYTWVYFLRTKDEAPDMIINFINQVQRSLKAQIPKIQTNNGTEFKNEKLRLFYAKLGIVHHTSINRMPQQNGVNHSVIHTQYNKTLYELIRGRKPNVQYFHVFGSLCYLIHDCDDLGKMKPKADIGIFIGYSESSKGPILKYSNFHDSSDDMNEIPSQQDLDHLFGPLYEEYYMSCTSDVTNDSAANTLDVKDTLSPSLIIVEDSDAPQIVTSSEEPIIQESSIPVLETHSDEQLQEDVAELDGNTIMHSF
ncbi:retrovirus-related pol polyprotein from transposon TNT 1-94 [Tanacetum coccineum]